MKRVLIIMNKWWECDPALNVLLNDNAKPKQVVKWPQPLNHPRPRPANPLPVNDNPQPRAVFSLNNISAEIWCISDLLEHYRDWAQYQSSSQRKMERLPLVFKGVVPDLVIAVGTAGLPSNVTENGSVAIGSSIFMHDCHPNGQNPDSQWNSGPFDQVLVSSLTPAKFAAFTNFDNSAPDRFLPAPLNPSWKPRVLAKWEYLALGAVNVTDYKEYDWTDQATLDAYTPGNLIRNAKSLETTHGLIRAQSNAPFMFVSGITDRVGFFHDEVDPRSYAQNTVAAHNAGVAIAWMLPNIDAAI